MASKLLNALHRVVQNVELVITTILTRKYPTGPSYAFDCNDLLNQQRGINIGRCSLMDVLNNNILWAVPKSRRTIERRLKRKFGVPKYIWKPYLPKKLLTCITCGHDHEPGRLCGHCYERVKLETKEMQTAIQENLGLLPVEENVIVLYKGEMDKYSNDQLKNKKIIELAKKRPKWFHENLLQSTTEEPSDSKDIKPNNLA